MSLKDHPIGMMIILPFVTGVSLEIQAQHLSLQPSEPSSRHMNGTGFSPNRELTLEENATLTDYMVYAALNNPGLEAAFNRWKAAVERIPQVKSLPDPKFTYGYFIEEVETRVGPQKNRFGLSQMFPWFGTLTLRGNVAAEAAEAAFQLYEAEKLRLSYRVKKAYYEYYYLYRAISITDDNIQLLKHLEGVARAKHKAGASQSGVIKAQVELGKLDDRLRSFQDLRGPMVASLNAILNRPPTASLPWPKQAPLHGRQFDEQELFRRLPSHNPELSALASLVDQQEEAVALARKAFYPNLTLGVDYIDTDQALAAGTPDSGKDPVIAKIALELPIWRGKYQAGLEEARRRRTTAQLAREDRANQLHADLKMAAYRFRDAERKINLYGDTLVPQAQQSLAITEEAYRAASEDFLNLIDAERLLLEFQLAHERALADREIAVAEIEMLVGKPFDSNTTK